uniref:Bromodomain and WD repeat-containing protein 3 isoform X1 n=1 Tax=Tanacetum cinerariifolium TaxID=118510 RepID=A0A6L2K7S7_TANCI|nr:bromodomain and WD repeat-containing protein 3 isoform X1 [Tanacetum cinerariifolium]
MEVSIIRISLVMILMQVGSCKEGSGSDGPIRRIHGARLQLMCAIQLMGNLVHSLTGYSESTYILDVHTFNIRIAMSDGYDGKTIVWDICEGVPIHIFEIERFKLVDGKFSPDGTFIVLSDEVGQLYILSTGQGEAQNNAKYDQFFLRDYRPLIQDVHGNVLDQETQLAPYRRNMQDLLYDSRMIPYPEPYQSMYQQRRLGSMGFEWRPSSVRFAVGTDISLVDQEYQWGDSENQISRNDTSRKSKTKKIKAEADFMTSSGRRVKRRNLDGEENSLRDTLSGKLRFDGEEDVLEGNSSQSYSSEQETEAGSEETEVSSENEVNGHLKGKAIVSEDLGSHHDNDVRLS